MRFNEEQTNEIYQFILKYNSDEEFKEKVEELYYEDPSKLSILEIYALEEILRFGDNGIYNSFLELQENNNENTIIDDLNTFLKLFQSDEYFRELKLEQFFNNPESLSKIESFALSVIIKATLDPKDFHKKLTDELEYDELTPIRYETDDKIRETLLNLLFGEFIHQVLDLPGMEPAKARQKSSGMIANIDKPVVLEAVRTAIAGSLEKTAQVIDQRFVPVKFNILLGKGEEAFSNYSKYNTNISAREILEYGNSKKR